MSDAMATGRQPNTKMVTAKFKSRVRSAFARRVENGEEVIESISTIAMISFCEGLASGRKEMPITASEAAELKTCVRNAFMSLDRAAVVFSGYLETHNHLAAAIKILERVQADD
jgi:hypothetical protein